MQFYINSEEKEVYSLKTTVKKLDYDKVMALPRPKHRHPIKPNIFWRVLIYLLTYIGMAGTKFRYETEGFEKLSKDEPCPSRSNIAAKLP